MDSSYKQAFCRLLIPAALVAGWCLGQVTPLHSPPAQLNNYLAQPVTQLTHVTWQEQDKRPLPPAQPAVTPAAKPSSQRWIF
ncbi:hypothetical protein IQ22_01985 [Pseudomonas duriflava]|uniref:Uncharacterized protein n=1 Tax=Pseudomonas duriflava TaxID=459528 RepID=A0A562QEF1_9PSED|nr:hypothetical protein [Pseudomonas duriflava]TWI55073.1 hypothetical protein IQ22_01985 [Pseudomonas duriflava]